MNEFDRGHLWGYREGQNDTLRGGLNEERPSFLRDPARRILVLALVFLSFALSWTHFSQTMKTLHMIQVVGANLDAISWTLRLEEAREEAENSRIRRQLQKRIRELAPEGRTEFARR